MAAKRTCDLIPFCHQVPLDACDFDINISKTPRHRESDGIESSCKESEKGGGVICIDCKVKTTNKTGVEMEALVGASHAALTVYDMLKAISHDLKIENIELIEKTGGKSTLKNCSNEWKKSLVNINKTNPLLVKNSNIIYYFDSTCLLQTYGTKQGHQQEILNPIRACPVQTERKLFGYPF